MVYDLDNSGPVCLCFGCFRLCLCLCSFFGCGACAGGGTPLGLSGLKVGIEGTEGICGGWLGIPGIAD